eukprot:TRINITY_DN66711_c1_g1_i1.p1 TRINITY_DN66711_c1_g1~~TRINITY_DN66711_c1_g1_i1.p1  ORF type:complete len:159 (+),score=11.51 TRINITY_DN66711_c1_g1_i1:594-1070(+)
MVSTMKGARIEKHYWPPDRLPLPKSPPTPLPPLLTFTLVPCTTVVTTGERERQPSTTQSNNYAMRNGPDGATPRPIPSHPIMVKFGRVTASKRFLSSTPTLPSPSLVRTDHAWMDETTTTTVHFHCQNPQKRECVGLCTTVLLGGGTTTTTATTTLPW